MKLTVWLATRDRHSWIMGAEIVALGFVLLSLSALPVRLVGLALLAHLGYSALTSLPLGTIPGRPDDAKQERRNQDLRSHVVGFLNEVRRVEDYAQHARAGGIPEKELTKKLRFAERRVMAAAAAVAKSTGRSTSPLHDDAFSVTRGLLIHDSPPGASPVV